MNSRSEIMWLLAPVLGIGLFVGICALLAFWAWRSGKRAAWRRFAQSSPRCGKCGYNMRGLRELTCPECGTEYTVEQLWLAQRDLPEP